MKIKPCPFCGGDVGFYWEDNRNCDPCWIECNRISCNARGPRCKNPYDAITAWNKRHNEVTPVDEVPNLDSQKREVLP